MPIHHHRGSHTIASVLFCLVLGHVQSAERKPQPSDQRSSAVLTNLRCEYLKNPIGLDIPQPRLSWNIDSPERDWNQRAYRVLVASTSPLLTADNGDIWDSGQVMSAESVHVQYRGRPLTSRQHCYWKVRVWDSSGRATDWSPSAFWEMGLLSETDWKARWIGASPADEPRGSPGFFKSTNELIQMNRKVNVDGRSTLLRKAFTAAKPISQARVYVTGLGYYEISCNGQRVGNHVLSPAKSNYAKWIFYDTYDISAQLRTGTNVLGLMLGNGWFNPYPKWWEPYRMQWFGSKRALLQLHIDYEDGSSEVIVSDDSWKTAPGPVLFSCVYDGEQYDATQERPNWDRVGTSETGWLRASLVAPPGGVLVSQTMPPIKVVEHISPVALTSPKQGVYIFDFGQNFAGWARLMGRGTRGRRVQLRYAEDLHADGSLDVTSNERAAATDSYIMKGDGLEVYEPRFTFHGFRYIEVTGFPGEPALTNFLGCVVHTDCESTGSFLCDNELINRIHRATRWSQRSNLMGYPMDCPQRDERLGWFGDAMVSMEEAMFNFEMPQFYRQWLEGIRFNQNESNGDISIVSPRPYTPDEPDPAWSSAYIIMAWQYYVYYGDRSFLAGHFNAMKRYVDYLGTQATNHILPKYWIGDWGTILKDWKEGEPISVGTAFYYYDTVIVAKAARVLGKEKEAESYTNLAESIKASFNRRFYDPVNQRYDQGSEFSNAFPLFLGLVPRSQQPQVLRQILDALQRNAGRFDVGVLGAKYLIEALTEFGRADVAYGLAVQTGYPSWAYMLENGRNTLSEFWDLHGSHNHAMMGSIDGWFYHTLAGIQVDETQPGFRHFSIKPFIPDSLSNVSASVQTIRGRVAVDWKKTKGSLNLRVGVPANTTATIHMPSGSNHKVRTIPYRRLSRFEKNTSVFEVGSGDFEFEAAW